MSGMPIQIVRESDVGRGIMAIAGDLRADEEAALLQDGARQTDLWGINLYPDQPGGELLVEKLVVP